MHFYTDGACSGNPGKGGWAWILHHNNQFKAYSGYDPHTTNNQMEMTAVMHTLEFITNAKINTECIIFTDSIYVRNGLLEWVENWKKQNWKTSTKAPVKNQELWIKMDALYDKLRSHVHIEWIKGHSTNIGNNIADMIATCSVNHNKHLDCKCCKYLHT